MGYTRVIQSGDQIELYEYSNKYVQKTRANTSRKTRRATYQHNSSDDIPTRNHQNIKRCRNNFIRIVTTNCEGKELPAFFTFTIEREVALEVGYAYLKDFWQIIKQKYNGVRYIGVPEWQRRGVLHFHFLVWGLPREVTDNKRERSTRNFQRQWHKGFCDVRNATYDNGGLGGYLAKYLTQTLQDNRLRNRRAYTASRNIRRPYSAGSNSLASYMGMIIPVDCSLEFTVEYPTMYLGICRYTKLLKK